MCGLVVGVTYINNVINSAPASY